MIDDVFVALDLETTGLNPDESEIIEVGAVRFVNGEVKETFHSLVKPFSKIPPKIQKLTGISDEMVSDAPDCKTVIENLNRFLENAAIIGHNIGFDIKFLEQYSVDFRQKKVYDTFQLSRFIWPSFSGYRLANLLNLVEIEIEGKPHRALHDALAAKEVFCKGIECLARMDNSFLLNILELVGPESNWSFYDLISKLTLQNPYTAKKKMLFPTVKNAVLRENRETETLFDTAETNIEGIKKNIDFGEEELSLLFKPNGSLQQVIPDYKYRSQQVDMLQVILDCFKEEKYSVIEAGTGTGKSLAYLVPAAYWSLKTGNKVVISTHTINLQEQLWHHDIPSLEKIFGLKINAALVKGRTNYLCLRKWNQVLNEKKYNGDEEINFYIRLAVWLNSTKTGDKSELNLNGEEKEIWSNLCGDMDTCLGVGCRWFNQNCFLTKAKRTAENADLLVVNHSLVFADLKTDNNVLPQYKYIVIDEAHHLEEEATKNLGYEVSLSGLNKILGKINRDFKGGAPGLLSRLKHFLMDILHGHPKLIIQATELMDDIITFQKESQFAKDEFFDQVKAFFGQNTGTEDKIEQSVKVVRIREIHLSQSYWESVNTVGDNLKLRLQKLAGSVEKMVSLFFSEDVQEEYKEGTNLAKELQFVMKSIENYVEDMKFILEVAEDNYVYWIEIASYPNDGVWLKAAPILIKNLLWEQFFNEKKSVVLTSATLTVDGGFDHFINKVGLDLASEDEVKTLDIATPFEYERQALLCVVNDMPNPTEVNEIAYAESIAPVLADIGTVFKGRTLCLFTSHRLLRETYDRLVPLVEEKGINVLGHKINGGRKGLVEEFIRNGRSILLGASSFWEGVDIPGELLSCVVIVKIPFMPPTIPTQEARVEQFQKEKMDGFYHYSIPQAVIKLKQGFGRLIRKEKDCGVVIILDKRIVLKRYGRIFLRSLPLKRHFKGDRNSVLQKVQDWLDGESSEGQKIEYFNDVSQIDRFIKKNFSKKKN